MTKSEIIENQMKEMRSELAEANHQVGRIAECLDSMSRILEKFEATDAEGTGYRYCYTREQKLELNAIIVNMHNACKRA